MIARKDFYEMLPHLWLSLLVACGPAGTPAETPAPRLEATNTLYDAGELVAGPSIRFQFPIKNAGTAPLQITRVSPGCGCLVAAYDRQLAPGASGTIAVVFNTAGSHGRVEKHITVETNDPQSARLLLTARAVLQQAVEVSPTEEIVLTSPPGPGEAVEQELLVRSYEKEPLQITRVACSSPSTQAAVLPHKRIGRRIAWRPDAFQVVKLTFPPGAVGKAIDETVTIDTNSQVRPHITVHLHSLPPSAVTAKPQRLYFGRVGRTADKPQQRVIVLSKRGAAPDQTARFQVLGVDAPDPLTVRVEPDPSGNLCEVIVEFQGGGKPGLIAGYIRIQTDDPERPEIQVPYTAMVGEAARSSVSAGAGVRRRTRPADHPGPDTGAPPATVSR
jgi:Protein of unknown function (DUF1573)